MAAGQPLVDRTMDADFAGKAACRQSPRVASAARLVALEIEGPVLLADPNDSH